MTVIDVFAAGGWAMWPLLVMSLASVTLMIERGIYWRTRGRPGPAWSAVRRNKPTDELRSAASRDSSVLGAFTSKLLDADHPEASAPALTERYRGEVERWGSTLAVIIAAAPMLGILGTVTGIIRSFNVLGANLGDPSGVAGGIAEALVTTAFGLSVAIVTLLPHAFSRSAGARCLARMDATADVVIALRENPRQ